MGMPVEIAVGDFMKSAKIIDFHLLLHWDPRSGISKMYTLGREIFRIEHNLGSIFGKKKWFKHYLEHSKPWKKWGAATPAGF